MLKICNSFIRVEAVKDEDGLVILGKYNVYAKMPDYRDFSVNVTLNTTNGMPLNVVNFNSESSKNASASVETSVIYQNIGGQLFVEQYVEKSKVEFFGNAVYHFDAFVFSQYK